MSPANLPLLSTEPLRLDLPDADVRLWRPAFQPAEADELLAAAALADRLAAGRHRDLRRAQARAATRCVARRSRDGVHVLRNGARAVAVDARTAADPPSCRGTHRRIAINSVLLNLYRDGRDGMGWHADDEPELGREPVIASVSFGATRRFKLRHRRSRIAASTLELAHGDLLLMAGADTTSRTCMRCRRPRDRSGTCQPDLPVGSPGSLSR